MEKIRVIQYGLGAIGSSILRLLLQKPQFEVVGAVDVDPAKVMRDAGQVANAGRDLGVPVSRTLASALAFSKADVVIHATQSTLPNIYEQLVECITAGVPVISTAEELAYPFRKYPELSAKLDKLAREHEVPVLGTGINPGFVMDKLPVVISAACHEVEGVRVHRIVDASRRRLALQKTVGAGLTIEQFAVALTENRVHLFGLPEAVGMIADSLGIVIDNIDEVVEPIVATQTVRSQFLEVVPGQVKGVRQVARATFDGSEKVRLDLEIYLGAPESIDEYWITGRPDLHVVIPGGVHGDLATAGVIVNTIPSLLKAEPGLRIATELPFSYTTPRAKGAGA